MNHLLIGIPRNLYKEGCLSQWKTKPKRLKKLEALEEWEVA
jgi:hypothetical protein